MTNNETSSFLRGVESRLDSLFGEEPKPTEEKKTGASQVSVEEFAATVKTDIPEAPSFEETRSETAILSEGHDLQETVSLAKDEVAAKEDDLLDISSLEEADGKSASSTGSGKTQDKAAFISEIDKRFSAIFGDDEKKSGLVKDVVEDIDQQADNIAPEEMSGFDQVSEDMAEQPSKVFDSPLADLKEIVHYLEQEVNDSILERLEEELYKVYEQFDDRVIHAFLRIIHFIGRYIRIRSDGYHQDSVNLLIYLYKQMENISVAAEMTQIEKYQLLMENIEQYRSWLEGADLERLEETQTLATSGEGIEPLEMEATMAESTEDQQPAETFTESFPVVEEILPDETAIDQTMQAESSIPEPAVVENSELAQQEIVRAEDPPIEAQPTLIEETPPDIDADDMERTVAVNQDERSAEAFAHALEEMKIRFQSEIDALKEEICLLKKRLAEKNLPEI